jgi:parallel beta-helix repeat protein
MHNLGYGIDEGNNNLLAQNVYAGVRDEISIFDEGFGIGFGSGNRLTRNVVTNEDYGIIMGNLAGSNTIDNNVALRNGVDLADFRHDCGVHIWDSNIFETSSPACIGGATTPLASIGSAATPVASMDALEKFSALLLKLRQWNPKRGSKTTVK